MWNTQSYLKSKAISVATAAVSAIATTLTAEWDLSESGAFAVQTEWGPNLTGTFTLWERADPALSWRQNTAASITNPAKSASGQVINNIGCVSKHWQLRFTRTSGTTGPLYASVLIKEIGA